MSTEALRYKLDSLIALVADTLLELENAGPSPPGWLPEPTDPGGPQVHAELEDELRVMVTAELLAVRDRWRARHHKLYAVQSQIRGGSPC